MTNSLKTLENSLYWQKVVFKQSRNQKQKERVKARIDKLEAEIAKLLTDIPDDEEGMSDARGFSGIGTQAIIQGGTHYA